MSRVWRRNMPCNVNRCLVCGQTAVDVKTDGRFVTTSCPVCLAVLTIEFDPPDQPELRARIERLDDADGGGTPFLDARRRFTSPGEASACDADRPTALARRARTRDHRRPSV